MLRFLSAGESHGQALVGIIEGMPAGLEIDVSEIDRLLALRQQGYGRGGRMKIERDKVKILSGVRHGRTLGSPIALLVENKDWENWQEVMGTGPGSLPLEKKVTRPRPGHADLAGAIKYRQDDIRNVLERASARETAMRVAVGSVAGILLKAVGIEVFSHVVQIGPAKLVRQPEIEKIKEQVLASPVRCADQNTTREMMRVIDEAKAQGDSLGGVFEILVLGVPVGFGSHVHWDRKLDGRLAMALMSIQAIKGVEIGLGFAAAGMFGSQVHDEIFYDAGRGFWRQTNRAGGLEGGMTNGEPLIVRAAMKPIPTLYTPLRSVDLVSKEPFEASVERSDVCAVPAASIVGEAAVAWELAVALLEKFPGDHIDDICRAVAEYRAYTRQV